MKANRSSTTLRSIHGRGKCHICGQPKAGPGSDICSYPHGMVPDEEVAAGMWSWKMPAKRKTTPKPSPSPLKRVLQGMTNSQIRYNLYQGKQLPR